jgi:hypothetical protein
VGIGLEVGELLAWIAGERADDPQIAAGAQQGGDVGRQRVRPRPAVCA